MFLYYLRHAFRRLRREPGFTSAAVLTLALGVGANVAVFALVEAVLLRPLPYDNAEELVVVRHRDTRTAITKEFIAIGDWVDLARRQSSFQSFGAYGTFAATVYGEGRSVPGARPRCHPGPARRPGDAAGAGAQPDRRGRDGGRRSRDAPRTRALAHPFRQRPRGRGSQHQAGRGAATRRRSGAAGVSFPAQCRHRGHPQRIHADRGARPAQGSGWTLGAGRLKPGRTALDATADLAAISRQIETRVPGPESGIDVLRRPAPRRDGRGREERAHPPARGGRDGAPHRLRQRGQPAAGPIPRAATRDGGAA